MSRKVIQELKRAVSAGARASPRSYEYGLAQESALSLLARSISFGHPRLALVRLAMAVQVGAQVPLAHWDYCRVAAFSSNDVALRRMFSDTADVASVHCESFRRWEGPPQ